MKSFRKAINFLKGSGSREESESRATVLGRMPPEMASRIRWVRRPSSSGQNHPSRGAGISNRDDSGSEAESETETRTDSELNAAQVRVVLPVPQDSWDVFDANAIETEELHQDEAARNEEALLEALHLEQESIIREEGTTDTDLKLTYHSETTSESSDEGGRTPPTPRAIGQSSRLQRQRLQLQHHHAAGRRHGRLHIPGHDQSMYFQGTLEEGRKLGFVSKRAFIHKYESFGIFGLYNIGNTCYMNSVLQCLSNTKPFIEFIVDNQRLFNELTRLNSGGSVKRKLLLLCFKDLISTVWTYSPRVSSPSQVTANLENIGDPTELKLAIDDKVPTFRGESQQDAHEFLNFFLDRIHGELNRSNVGNGKDKDPDPVDESEHEDGDSAWAKYLRSDNSVIVDHFVGQLKSTLSCARCGLKSVKYEPFWDLSVPIVPPGKTYTDIDTDTGESISLTKCFQLLLEENTLDHENLFHCSNCGGQERFTKRLQIERFPRILIIHLKRFSSLEMKILTPVEYPVHGLDMGQFGFHRHRRPSVSYNLFGIVDHLGYSHLDGHYIAHCKHPFNYFGNWYTYDDTSVSPVTPSTCSSDAYMLLYEMSLASRDILNI